MGSEMCIRDSLVFLALTGVGIAIIAIAAAAVYAAKQLGLFNNEMEEFNYTASETNAMAGDFDFGEQYAIPDAQESRGLGDVYKRQDVNRAKSQKIEGEDPGSPENPKTVSYTHLTLPTKRIV